MADRAATARQQQERMDAALLAEHAAAKATALETARRELERAVQAVRTAKTVGRGRVEADQVWKVAKALVIELDTGTPPAWAPKPSKPTQPSEPVDHTESVEVGEEFNPAAVEVAADCK